MSFSESVRACLAKYVAFGGRARRSEFWYFALFSVLVEIIVAIVDAAVGSSILGVIVGLGLLLPSLAVSVRRLHDTNRSGWLILIGIIPLVGAIVLIVFYCQDSTPGENAHGLSPKGSPNLPAQPYGSY